MQPAACPRPSASLSLKVGERLLGLVHLLVGAWLVHLTVAVALDLAAGYTLTK